MPNNEILEDVRAAKKAIAEMTGAEPQLQTEVELRDGERVVLFHDKPITAEEIEAFKEFTKHEVICLLKVRGFAERRL